MADQDELVQVGSELMLEESVAQDNTGQEDLSLRPRVSTFREISLF